MINGGWLAVRVTPGEQREGVLAALFELGALAIQEIGQDVATQFPETVGRERIETAVRGADRGARLEITSAAPVDWSKRWRESIRAHDLGALTVAPPWLADGLDPARTIVIEPEMAFGTGEHATTRGVIRLLPSVLTRGDRVADLGAGSAVLSIAAAKLGARRVAAIEIDPDAIGNAESNVRLNGVGGIVSVVEGDAGVLLPLVAPVDLVLANIISSAIIALLPVISAAVADGGGAILSGVLQTEREELREALERHRWRIDAEDTEDIWWSGSIVRS
jgi:ribosomal protein L11 methyltransferase